MTTNDKSYTATIELEKPPRAVFKHLTTDVSKWWGGKDLQGPSLGSGDEFTIRHGDVHFSRQKVVEFAPDQRLVWLVTESKLAWLTRDTGEWTHTRMVFELSAKGRGTVLRFTHEGLTPQKECHSRCVQGWEMVIKDWFFRFVAEGRVSDLVAEGRGSAQISH